MPAEIMTSGEEGGRQTGRLAGSNKWTSTSCSKSRLCWVFKAKNCYATGAHVVRISSYLLSPPLPPCFFSFDPFFSISLKLQSVESKHIAINSNEILTWHSEGILDQASRLCTVLIITFFLSISSLLNIRHEAPQITGKDKHWKQKIY